MTLAAIATAVLAQYGGLAIATFTLFAGLRDLRRRATIAAVADHEKRIVSLTERVEACERDRQSLKDENYRLMSRIMTLENRPA